MKFELLLLLLEHVGLQAPASEERATAKLVVIV
jgi:hypothetical protein